MEARSLGDHHTIRPRHPGSPVFARIRWATNNVGIVGDSSRWLVDLERCFRKKKEYEPKLFWLCVLFRWYGTVERESCHECGFESVFGLTRFLIWGVAGLRVARDDARSLPDSQTFR